MASSSTTRALSGSSMSPSLLLCSPDPKSGALSIGHTANSHNGHHIQNTRNELLKDPINLVITHMIAEEIMVLQEDHMVEWEQVMLYLEFWTSSNHSEDWCQRLHNHHRSTASQYYRE